MQINSKIYSNFCSNKNFQTANIIIAEDRPHKKGLNIPVLATSTVGTLIPLYFIAKRQSGSLLKLKPFQFMDLKLDKLKDILLVATGSITGGLLGGIIKDKGENTRRKIKEATHQLIANIGTPMVAVCALIKLVDKNIPESASKWVRIPVKAGTTVGGIVGGYLVGSAIVGFINNKIVDRHEKFDRKVHAKDLIYQADEVAAACAVSNANTVIPIINIPASKLLGKIIPFFFVTAGYEAGKS